MAVSHRSHLGQLARQPAHAAATSRARLCAPWWLRRSTQDLDCAVPRGKSPQANRGRHHSHRGTRNADSGAVTVEYTEGQQRSIKTVWHRATHDAGTYGSSLLRNILGEGGRFAFPKSIYAVRDAVAAVVGNQPNALLVDFFAGSATTLNAVNLLNATDGGQRQCILVTNNEVSEEENRTLTAQGFNQDRTNGSSTAFAVRLPGLVQSSPCWASGMTARPYRATTSPANGITRKAAHYSPTGFCRRPQSAPGTTQTSCRTAARCCPEQD